MYRNDLGGKYERVASLEAFAQASIVTAVAGDTDADGQAEIFAWGSEGLVRWVPESWKSWRKEVLCADLKVAEAPRIWPFATCKGTVAWN